jgi:hypothetical protein
MSGLIGRSMTRAVYEIIPPIGLFRAQRIIRSRLSDADIMGSDQRYNTWFALDGDKLDELIKDEHDRAKSFDDKAAKITAVLAIALTIGSTFAKSIVDEVARPSLKLGVRGGLIISMLYIVAGGWIGFVGGTKPRREIGYGADWEVLLKKNKSDTKRRKIDALARFEQINLLKSNEIDGALSCVRNGIVILTSTLLTVISESLLSTRLSVLRALADCEAFVSVLITPVREQEVFSSGELLLLVFIVCGFLVFAITLGWVSRVTIRFTRRGLIISET